MAKKKTVAKKGTRSKNRRNAGSAFYGYVVYAAQRGGRWLVRRGVSDEEKRVHGPNWHKTKGAATKAAAAKNRKRAALRSNPEELAAKKYEEFHGQPPAEVVKVTTPMHTHSVLAGIGKLIELRVKSINGGKVILKNFDKGKNGPAYLAESEGVHGPQLYIEGGDQGVDLKAFGILKPHERELLGAATDVIYATTKTHLAPEDGGKARYHHKFGWTKKNGRPVRVKNAKLPVIMYDVRNKLLHIIGGSYTIPAVGIDG